MPRIEINHRLVARLEQVAHERGCSVEEVITSMLGLPDEALLSHPLVVFTQSPEFRVKNRDADRFLAILAWVAAHHAEEFSDFVANLESRRRYLGMSAEEIRETCSHNQARQIPGTHYWAIMNLDTPTKRRFLRRLLVFVGETDAVIEYVAGVMGPRTGAKEPSGWPARGS